MLIKVEFVSLCFIWMTYGSSPFLNIPPNKISDTGKSMASARTNFLNKGHPHPSQPSYCMNCQTGLKKKGVDHGFIDVDITTALVHELLSGRTLPILPGFHPSTSTL